MKVEVDGQCLSGISDVIIETRDGIAIQHLDPALFKPVPPVTFSMEFSHEDEPIGRSLKPDWILRFDVDGHEPIEARVLSVTETADGGVTLELERI